MAQRFQSSTAPATRDGIAIALEEDTIPVLHRLAVASDDPADPGLLHEILAFTL